MKRDLTPRQRQVAKLVRAGLPNKEIARVLGRSPRTVENLIRDAAQRIPGDGWPRHKLTMWFIDYDRDQAA